MPAHAPRHGAGQLHGPPVTAQPLVRAGRRKSARWIRRAVNDTSGPDAIATAHVDRCFYVATLAALDAPELSPTYCHVDDILYDHLAPSIEWARTGTLAAGCDRCDFRYLHTRAHPPTTAGPVPDPSAPRSAGAGVVR